MSMRRSESPAPSYNSFPSIAPSYTPVPPKPRSLFARLLGNSQSSVTIPSTWLTTGSQQVPRINEEASQRDNSSSANRGIWEVPADVLNTLHPIYYCLYVGSGIIPSIRPVDPLHPFLSMFYIEHVHPPGTLVEMAQHICHRENISYTRATIYARSAQGTNTNLNTPIPAPVELLWNRSILSSARGYGTPDNPYQLMVNEEKRRSRWDTEHRMKPGLLFAGIVDNKKMHHMTVDKIASAHPLTMTFPDINHGSSTMHPVYYRVYWRAFGALPSRKPLRPSDPSLSRTYIEYLPPPTSGRSYIYHFAALEGIHPSRITLFRRGAVPGSGYRKISDNTEILWSEDGAGGSIANPLLILVTGRWGGDFEFDRKDASKKLASRKLEELTKLEQRSTAGDAVAAPAY